MRICRRTSMFSRASIACILSFINAWEASITIQAVQWALLQAQYYLGYMMYRKWEWAGTTEYQTT